MAVTGIESVHLVTPIVRCISSVRPRDAHDTPFFSEFLQTNRPDRPGDTFELSTIHDSAAPKPAQSADPMPTPLLPNLGEVIDVQPRPKVAVNETKLYQQLLPATGHALDIYA